MSVVHNMPFALWVLLVWWVVASLFSGETDPLKQGEGWLVVGVVLFLMALGGG